MTNTDVEIKMRKKLRAELEDSQKTLPIDKKTVDDLRARYAEWDLNARNSRVK